MKNLNGNWEDKYIRDLFLVGFFNSVCNGVCYGQLVGVLWYFAGCLVFLEEARRSEG